MLEAQSVNVGAPAPLPRLAAPVAWEFIYMNQMLDFIDNGLLFLEKCKN